MANRRSTSQKRLAARRMADVLRSSAPGIEPSLLKSLLEDSEDVVKQRAFARLKAMERDLTSPC